MSNEVKFTKKESSAISSVRKDKTNLVITFRSGRSYTFPKVGSSIRVFRYLKEQKQAGKVDVSVGRYVNKAIVAKKK